MMTIEEHRRRALFDGLATAIGPHNADTLMNLLPSAPGIDLVTRSDLQATAIMLRGEMAELRSDLRGEMAELRDDLGKLRLDLARWLVTSLIALAGMMAGMVVLVERLSG